MKHWRCQWPNSISHLHRFMQTYYFLSAAWIFLITMNCAVSTLYNYEYLPIECVLLDEYSSEARSIGALTTLCRSDWAKVRSEYLTSGVNKQSLDALESAIFHVSPIITWSLVISLMARMHRLSECFLIWF